MSNDIQLFKKILKNMALIVPLCAILGFFCLYMYTLNNHIPFPFDAQNFLPLLLSICGISTFIISYFLLLLFLPIIYMLPIGQGTSKNNPQESHLSSSREHIAWKGFIFSLLDYFFIIGLPIITLMLTMIFNNHSNLLLRYGIYASLIIALFLSIFYAKLKLKLSIKFIVIDIFIYRIFSLSVWIRVLIYLFGELFDGFKSNLSIILEVIAILGWAYFLLYLWETRRLRIKQQKTSPTQSIIYISSLAVIILILNFGAQGANVVLRSMNLNSGNCPVSFIISKNNIDQFNYSLLKEDSHGRYATVDIKILLDTGDRIHFRVFDSTDKQVYEISKKFLGLKIAKPCSKNSPALAAKS